MFVDLSRLFIPLLLAVAVSTVGRAQDLQRARIGDAELAYVETGQGDPLVLVHGGLQDFRLWDSLSARFAERHRVIAYSRRNHFPNPVAEDGAPDGAADLHGNDLALLVEALGLGRVHVVAHSSGAVAALFFAKTHPELVRTLSLNEPPAAGFLAAVPDGPGILRDFASRLSAARDAFLARDLDRAIRLFADGVGGPGTFDRRSPADQRMARDNALSHLADNLSQRPRAPFGCDAAKMIKTPTLLTSGERSQPFFHRILDELARCMPQVERVVVSDASHTVPGENPQAYGEAVLAFISRH